MMKITPAARSSWAPSVAPMPHLSRTSQGVRPKSVAKTAISSVRCFGGVGLPKPSPIFQARHSQTPSRPTWPATVCSASAVEGNVTNEAYGIRRIAWISFWAQLSLAIVSAIVVAFTLASSNWGNVPPVPVLFTLFGVATSFISTFLSFGIVRTTRKVIMEKATIKKESIASTLLANQALNLWGIGSALIGLQATVGTLVAKILTSSTSNPYAAAGQAARTATPTALDAFSVQACTNTILAHFASIVFANWLQKTLLKPQRTPAKPQEPDYTQRRGPSGAAY
ncbi:g4591 [Coccomyxa elongata]